MLARELRTSKTAAQTTRLARRQTSLLGLDAEEGASVPDTRRIHSSTIVQPRRAF